MRDYIPQTKDDWMVIRDIIIMLGLVFITVFSAGL
jgi:hypothetical protein